MILQDSKIEKMFQSLSGRKKNLLRFLLFFAWSWLK